MSLCKSYGLIGLFFLALYKIYTLIFFRDSRLIRFPIYIRGKYAIDFGVNLTTGRHCRIDAFPLECNPDKVIIFGRDVQINDNVHIGGINRIVIGDNVLIASRVYIGDHDHGSYSGTLQSSPLTKPALRILKSEKITIGDNVWIGEGAMILKGSIIGSGSIIGAGSIVNGTVPENSICAGSPFRVVKRFDGNKKAWVKKF